MTTTDGTVRSKLDEISLTVDRLGTASVHLGEIRSLYESVYTEPPYCEGSKDVDDFITSWPKRQAQPSFRVIIAWQGTKSVGFSFGHELNVRTAWWQGLQDPVSTELTREYVGRTFAIIELAVLQPYRRCGIGKELHTHLLAGLPHERATLLVRPDATAAQRAYQSWGYQHVGQIQPFNGAPVYDAMILDLCSDRHRVRNIDTA